MYAALDCKDVSSHLRVLSCFSRLVIHVVGDTFVIGHNTDVACSVWGHCHCCLYKPFLFPFIMRIVYTELAVCNCWFVHLLLVNYWSVTLILITVTWT